MTLIAERIAVLAKEFVETKNINDSQEINEPMFRAKQNEFGWDISFAAPVIACEIIWKLGIKGGGQTEFRQFDRMFTPSAIATHANFRGSDSFKTGNLPEVGSIAVWKKGNSWQGSMAIVVSVSDDKKTFDVVQGKSMKGEYSSFILMEFKEGKKLGLPFKSDKMNLIGFIYPPNREIS